MGILCESSTPIEFLVKDALIKENLSFHEQYRIGTGERFSTVKYVADFLVVHENIRLIIECDGRTYHSSKKQKKKSAERDEWLLYRGYRILHFTTEEIRYKMPFVINQIKYSLGIIDKIPEITEKTTPYHRISSKEYEVNLFCYYSQLPQGICVAYMYEDNTRGICSEFRQKQCANIPPEMAETTAIYLALLDLKKNVNVHVFYSGQVFNDHFDVNKKIRSKLILLKDGTEILKNHEFCFTHVNLYRKYSYLREKNHKIMEDLKSECLNTCKKIVNGKEFDGYFYQSLVQTAGEI